MHCNICDRQLSEAEILVSPDGKGFEPCSTCMEIILDAAYSDGFHRPDDDVETLDDDTFVTTLDLEQDQFHLPFEGDF